MRVTCCVLPDFSDCVSAGNKHSRISVLFPEPLTPVTTTSRPKGNFNVKSLRLFFDAPCKTSAGQAACLFLTLLLLEDGGRRDACPTLTGRRSPRVGYFLCARKHFPVSDSGCCSNSSKVPAATTCPPCTPAPGPKSTTKSARRIVSSSCSTTTTELPRERNFSSVASSCSLSRACNPNVGFLCLLCLLLCFVLCCVVCWLCCALL